MANGGAETFLIILKEIHAFINLTDETYGWKNKKERKVLFPVSTVIYLKIWIAGSIDPFWLVSTAQPATVSGWVGVVFVAEHSQILEPIEHYFNAAAYPLHWLTVIVVF